MHGHEHFDELADLLASPATDEARRPSMSGGNISRQLLGEVLSRVAVNTPPVTTRVNIANGSMLRVGLPLSEGSVSKASAALLRYGLLEEDDPVRERRGRPVVPVRLGRTSWFSIGVHLDQDLGVPVHATAVAATLEGQVLATRHQEITAEPAGEWPMVPVVEAIVALVEQLIEDDAISARKHKGTGWLPLLGVGVEIGRHVDQGNVIDRHRHGHWQEHSLGSTLAAKLGIPVIVENDANALAVRETYGDQVSHRDFALVLVADEGVGSAIAVDGRVYRGSRGMAGEIGHLTVQPPKVTTRTDKHRGYGFSDPCWCGQPNHIDVFATPLRLRHELGLEDLNKIGDLDTEQRQRTTELFAAAGRALGQGIAALINIVNPAQVLLILPPAFSHDKGGIPGTKYLEGVKSEINGTFSTGATDTHLTVRTWDSNKLAVMGARAAATRVLIEFIDHLSGIDGCLPSDSATPSWPTSRGTAALIGSALGGPLGAVVGGAIGAAAVAALHVRTRSSPKASSTARPKVGNMARMDLVRRFTGEDCSPKR